MKGGSISAPLGLALVLVACSYGNSIEGRIVAEDGEVGVRCIVTTRPAEFINATPARCGVADAPGYVSPESVVPLGDRFRCSVSANIDRVYDLQIQCPGYEPLAIPVLVESCVGFFKSCDDIQAGTLTVRR